MQGHVRSDAAIAMALWAILSLSACSGGGSSSPGSTNGTAEPAASSPAEAGIAAQIAALEKQGKLPMLDRSTSVAGPDTNNNGIRDDIDAYIAALPLTDAQRPAAQQEARSLQRTVTVDLKNRDALAQASDLIAYTTKCLADRFGEKYIESYKLSEKLEAVTMNTRERTKAYLAFNKALSGSVTHSPKGDACDDTSDAASRPSLTVLRAP